MFVFIIDTKRPIESPTYTVRQQIDTLTDTTIKLIDLMKKHKVTTFNELRYKMYDKVYKMTQMDKNFIAYIHSHEHKKDITEQAMVHCVVEPNAQRQTFIQRNKQRLALQRSIDAYNKKEAYKKTYNGPYRRYYKKK